MIIGKHNLTIKTGPTLRSPYGPCSVLQDKAESSAYLLLLNEYVCVLSSFVVNVMFYEEIPRAWNQRTTWLSFHLLFKFGQQFVAFIKNMLSKMSYVVPGSYNGLRICLFVFVALCILLFLQFPIVKNSVEWYTSKMWLVCYGQSRAWDELRARCQKWKNKNQ